MPWFKVDDGFANSKPVLRIPRRYRCQSIGLWILAGTWSAKELTDGFIPDYVLAELGGSAALAEHLVRAGLWEKAESGFQVVRWSDYQPTKSQVMERRANEAERKQRARDAKRNKADQQIVDNVRMVSQWDMVRSPHGVRKVSALPDPTRPDPTPISRDLGGELTSVGPRCPLHANDPTPPPCGACADARRANEANKQTSEAQEHSRRARLRAQIDACARCDERGLIETDGDQLARCQHQAATSA